MLSPLTDGSLDGIISHLTRKCGRNVHDREMVEIFSMSSHGTSYRGKNAADLQTTTFFESEIWPYQWLCYDFKALRVKPTHYSIHAHSDNWHLRWWNLEGSVDGSSWILLDE
jgi:hypothetical protein